MASFSITIILRKLFYNQKRQYPFKKECSVSVARLSGRFKEKGHSVSIYMPALSHYTCNCACSLCDRTVSKLVSSDEALRILWGQTVLQSFNFCARNIFSILCLHVPFLNFMPFKKYRKIPHKPIFMECKDIFNLPPFPIKTSI